ncbi:uridine kinase [Actinophytocola gossypii]|uniref:Uridine kinase n=1 Tax=Actinophytocola gossypii TaxID=2812003 RepID=A0ABT2JCG8_9PSEU|nr:uridine kinase [Actinophytocola gossypii]MCT2585259.1 uridine kinase [Actinophytocola gossypii]
MLEDVRFRPISPELLVDEVAERVAGRPAGAWARVAVDGAPPADPAALADALAEALRLRGRSVLRVSAGDFLRPASLRFERGREDPDARYDDWLDVGGLRREVLDPLEAGGTGRVLPTLWNAETDRASRAEYVALAEGGVLVLDGTLLLGRGLPFEHTVHLWISAPALARRTPAAEAWMLPAFARYDAEARPLHVADTGVRVDDPARPAVLDDSPV